MIPVFVAKHEVRLTGQRQQRDLVQDRVHPEALDDVFHGTLILVAAGVLRGREFDVDLLGRPELEGLQEREVRVVEVWAFFLQPCALFGGDADIRERWRKPCENACAYKTQNNPLEESFTHSPSAPAAICMPRGATSCAGFDS